MKLCLKTVQNGRLEKNNKNNLKRKEQPKQLLFFLFK
jgi:hypothetical protein